MHNLCTDFGLEWLARGLDAHRPQLDAARIESLLSQTRLTPTEIQRYVTAADSAPSRRCLARNETYELVMLTWRGGEQSVVHDHCGSICGLKVVSGHASENAFCTGADGQARAVGLRTLAEGDVTVDAATGIHAIGNESASAILVTLHIYAPPLPEVRHYTVTEKPPAQVFVRDPAPAAKTIAIIGGGFSGAMTLANILRLSSDSAQPLHVVLIDRQPAFGEGVAYRTTDTQHLLNVPAGRMSAWPDRPDDFLNFARQQDPQTLPTAFLPRRLYGRYIRQTVLHEANAATPTLSASVHREEATQLTRSEQGGWKIQTTAGHDVHADVAVIAVGHRPPNDILGKRWAGPCHRLINDPWASPALHQIEGHEPVFMLGSGLTAIDTLLTLTRRSRTAPIYVVSRRGLLPRTHAPRPLPAEDLSLYAAGWLNADAPLTVKRLTADVRQIIEVAGKRGIDWRQVVDGLRPMTAKLWGRLNVTERLRFLTHVRPLWEIHRHRMAPEIAARIQTLRSEGLVHVTAGAVISARAESEHIDIAYLARGTHAHETQRVAWLINCTGPGVQGRHCTHPLLQPLLESGTLMDDELSLGLMTDDDGRAVDARGNIIDSLLITGTLRKATLWESTAVPELRQQAQGAARAALATIRRQQLVAK